MRCRQVLSGVRVSMAWIIERNVPNGVERETGEQGEAEHKRRENAGDGRMW